MTTAFGIDFGTTNSVLATTSGRHVTAISLDDQLPGEWVNSGFDKVLPSVIGFRGQTPTFGWLAKKQTESRLEAVKRLFATEDEVTIGMHRLRVEEVAAMFFRHIQKQAAAAGLVDRLDRAVVTVPANSRGKARYRTKVSAGLAGIEVMALINEPTAAAMAHARAIGENQRILVFDWGGGTLDVTVLQAIEGTFIEQASKGIQRLGGIDVDAAFYDFATRKITGTDRWSVEQQNTFRLELERVKVELSSQTATQAPIPTGGFLEVTRAQFEEAVGSLIARTREPVEVCLRESPGRIDHLVMVGGSSKMPVIQRFISDIVGAEPSDRVDPMTAIAEGAAIAAGVLLGTIDDVDFFVGTEHALGTVIHNEGSDGDGQFSVLIRRNTKLPAKATDTYNPAFDMQEKVDIRVIEGDPDLPISHDDNVILKAWRVDLLEPRPVSEAAFDITYEYDVDGILHVRAVDVKTQTIMMDEELAFGAAENRSQLPEMRRRVDSLMAAGPVGAVGEPEVPVSGGGLSGESLDLIGRAKTKILPFVPDSDRKTLEDLIAKLEVSSVGDEVTNRDALQREMRNHAYLL